MHATSSQILLTLEKSLHSNHYIQNPLNGNFNNVVANKNFHNALRPQVNWKIKFIAQDFS
jgi:hypothetical protein